MEETVEQWLERMWAEYQTYERGSIGALNIVAFIGERTPAILKRICELQEEVEHSRTTRETP